MEIMIAPPLELCGGSLVSWQPPLIGTASMLGCEFVRMQSAGCRPAFSLATCASLLSCRCSRSVLRAVAKLGVTVFRPGRVIGVVARVFMLWWSDPSLRQGAS